MSKQKVIKVGQSTIAFHAVQPTSTTEGWTTGEIVWDVPPQLQVMHGSGALPADDGVTQVLDTGDAWLGSVRLLPGETYTVADDGSVMFVKED